MKAMAEASSSNACRSRFKLDPMTAARAIIAVLLVLQLYSRIGFPPRHIGELAHGHPLFLVAALFELASLLLILCVDSEENLAFLGAMSAAVVITFRLAFYKAFIPPQCACRTSWIFPGDPVLSEVVRYIPEAIILLWIALALYPALRRLVQRPRTTLSQLRSAP